MKLLIALACILAIVACQNYSFDVSGECNFASCKQKSSLFNNYYNVTCPKVGMSKANFRVQNGYYFLDLLDQINLKPVSIPLIYERNATKYGLQFYSSQFNGISFGIMNCTLPAAQRMTNLCQKHQLVAGKIKNATFLTECGFGLDRSRQYLESSDIIYESDE